MTIQLYAAARAQCARAERHSRARACSRGAGRCVVAVVVVSVPVIATAVWWRPRRWWGREVSMSPHLALQAVQRAGGAASNRRGRRREKHNAAACRRLSVCRVLWSERRTGAIGRVGPMIRRLRDVFIVVLWFAANIGVVFLNKLLLSNYKFEYPVFLTGCHVRRIRFRRAHDSASLHSSQL